MNSTKLHLRDLFWLTLVVGLSIALVQNHFSRARYQRELTRLGHELKNQEVINLRLQRAIEDAGLGVDWLSGSGKAKLVPPLGTKEVIVSSQYRYPVP